MGGTIVVSSEVGQGTVFEVDLPSEVVENTPASALAGRLPRSVEANASAATALSAAPSAAGPVLDRANLVLIIDDDPSVCELIRRNLKEEGIDSIAANNGEEGLKLAKQRLPSAIILDILMPGIDGWAVLAALKTDAELMEIPVIMASMLDEKERGLRMGADAYVPKPFGPDRLAELIRKHLRGRESGKILCIESRSMEGERVAGWLKERGWEVSEATDGPQVLDRLQNDPPDLILIDLVVPDDGGMTLLAQVRGNDAWLAIPIIVITASDLAPEARQRLQGQVEKIFTTGVFGRDDLVREVRSLVARHRDDSQKPPELEAREPAPTPHLQHSPERNPCLRSSMSRMSPTSRSWSAAGWKKTTTSSSTPATATSAWAWRLPNNPT